MRPLSPQPLGAVMSRIAFLNDTYEYYHWGCTATSGAIRRRLGRLGHDVCSIQYAVTVMFDVLPERLAEFDDPAFFARARAAHQGVFDAIASASAVVVNAEGSMHRVQRISLALLYLIHASKRHLGRPVHLINGSIYPEPIHSQSPQCTPNNSAAFAIYGHVLGNLDELAIREHVSHALMRQAGVKAALSFDCLPLTLEERRPHLKQQTARRVVVAGSSALTPERIAGLAAYLSSMHADGYEICILTGARSYPAPDEAAFAQALTQHGAGRWIHVDAKSLDEWFGCLASAAVLVSGRFHHTIAASFLRVPCVLLEANTPKNVALAESFGYELPLAYDHPHMAEALRERTRVAIQRGPVDATILDGLRERAERNFDGLARLSRAA